MALRTISKLMILKIFLSPAHSAFAQEMKPQLNNLFRGFPVRCHTKPGHLRLHEIHPDSWSFSLHDLPPLSLFPLLKKENVSFTVAKDKDPGITTIPSRHTQSQQSQQQIPLVPSSKCTQSMTTFFHPLLTAGTKLPSSTWILAGGS